MILNNFFLFKRNNLFWILNFFFIFFFFALSFSFSRFSFSAVKVDSKIKQDSKEKITLQKEFEITKGSELKSKKGKDEVKNKKGKDKVKNNEGKVKVENIKGKGEGDKGKSKKIKIVKKVKKKESNKKEKSNKKRESISGQVRFENLIQHYKKQRTLSVQFEKETDLSFLGKKVKSYGELFLSSGKVRLEVKRPQKSLLLYDGETIWWEETLPKALGGTIRVTRSKANLHQGKFNIFLTLFTNSNRDQSLDLSKTFQVLNYTHKKNKEFFDVALKDLDLHISKISLVVHGKRNRIDQISYSDELENKVTYSFKRTFFNRKLKNKWRYKVPKKAEIIDY